MTRPHVFAENSDSIRERVLEPAVAPPIRLEGPRVWKSGICDRATAELVHDFRNILGAIHGLADLAFLEELENSRSALHMDEIRRACRDGGELCQQMLNHSRSELVEFESFDLSEVIQQMEMQLRVCVPTTFVLELDLAPAPVLAASRGKLQRVLLNLVKNAAESLEGRAGVVRIRTGTSFSRVREIPEGRVAQSAIPLPRSFLIVSDTGCGMSKAGRARLLSSSAIRFSGHGLGFASVRRMVAKCGGVLRIASQAGRGTTVSLAFPHADTALGDIVIDPRLNMRQVHPG